MFRNSRRFSWRFLALAAMLAALSLTVVTADARPNSSFGSRGSRTFSAPPPTATAPNAARPMDRTMTQQSPGQARPTTPTTPSFARPGGFFGGGLLGGLAAGFLGAGLFGMLFGHGFLGGMGGFASFIGLLFQIILVVIVARLAWAWWQRRNETATAGGPSYRQGLQGGDDRPQQQSMLGGLFGGGSQANGAPQGEPIQLQPDDFSTFEKMLGDIQTAYGREDLGTRLDWVAVDHWNTDNPHIHIILRGRTDDGQDLVISRDYIKEGMRARAQDLVTQELGPRTDLEIHRNLERQVEAERWTQLDRQLVRDAGKSGIIDLAPLPDRQPDEFHTLKVGRLRTLEIRGLAEEIGLSQWFIKPEAEAVLRELGERGDIIKRMHRALTERGIERGSASYVLAGESLDVPVIGRLVERGLDDELKGTAYAVVDGTDGRTHHIKLPHLDAAGDSPPGSIVELRSWEDPQGQRRVALAVRADLDLGAQVGASGATWLDRQAIARDPIALSDSGFGAEVRQALDERAEHLIGEGFAERQGGRVVFARRLLSTLRQRELDNLGEKLATETGMSFERAASGEYVAGSYRQRFALASGRFAMIDDGLGFQLVPWSPSLEKQIGRHVSGVARDDGGVDWDFGRKRSLGL